VAQKRKEPEQDPAEQTQAPVDGDTGVAGPDVTGGLTYASAGVDIEAGDETVRRIKGLAESTYIPGVLGTLGGFSGLYEMPSGMKQPVLVTATDGVGTKLLVAQEMGKLNTVGIDLVAMSVNDVLTVGASPILFLDYIATGRLDPLEIESVVEGIADGCREAGCALIGGETAEMPGLYAPKEFDLAGFCVGLAEKDNLVDGSKLAEGDVVIGLASNGLHSNGFSLVRRILEINQCGLGDKFPHFGETIAYMLLQPTRIYVNGVWALFEKGVPIHGMAHVTGGGIGGNLSRVVPEGLCAALHFDNWKVPKLFRAIQHLGEIEELEMFRTFNMGIGYVVVVPFASAEWSARLLQRAGYECMYLGSIVRGEKRVTLSGVF
jgi:phosphoribosylformylglycinamidine cyclo-ligase